MFTRVRLRRNRPYGLTVLEMDGPDSHLELKLISRLDPRSRRAFVRAFIGQIRPWITHFSTGGVSHSGKAAVCDARSRRIGIPEFQARPLETLEGGIGMRIRMRRLEIGWSQAELAKRLGINRSHLSQLERGRHLPSERTVVALRLVLDTDGP